MGQPLVVLAEDLHGFLLASEAPVLLRRRTAEEVWRDLTEAAEALRLRFAAERERVGVRLRTRLDETASSLRAMAEELRATHPALDRLERHWKGLGTSYEALRAYLGTVRHELPEAPRLAPIKPKNYARNVFHVGMALSGVLTYAFLLERPAVIAVTGSLVGLFFVMEFMRRRSEVWNRRFVEGAFRHIARPGEAHQVPAATWYALAIFLGAIFLPKDALLLGALSLGFGDPAAQIIGKRFGRRKLVGQKSVAGALAFVAVTALVSALYLALALPADHALRAPLPAALLPLLLGFVGATTEAFSGRIDDNFTIPLAVGFTALPFFA
jgi:dolichol kinase